MQTPWGKLPVSDAHVHFFSHRFLELLTSGGHPAAISAQLGWQAAPEDPGELAAHWVAELDRNEVQRAALISSIPGDESSVAAALERYPDRFFGQFLLNPLAPDAPERTAAAFASGFGTVCLFPAMHRFSVADPQLDWLWPLAARRNVFVHCGMLRIGVRDRLGLPSPFDLRYSNPIDIQPVATRHPGVRFIVPHFGAGYLREALMLAGHCRNVYLDTSSSNDWIRYADATLDLELVFRKAIDVAGPERLLFGTDSSFFPRGWVRNIFERQVNILFRLGLPVAEARAIFSGNLESLYAPRS